MNGGSEDVKKFKIGVSACLLGERVRYDGGHKLDRLLIDALGEDVTYVPVCPEVECGLGVPREAMRLEGDPDAPRLVKRCDPAGVRRLPARRSRTPCWS